MTFLILSATAAALFIIWLIGFLHANDLTVPTLKPIKLTPLRRLMLIFPHPDDEGFSSVGLITKLHKLGVEVTWLILTRGESGTQDGRADRQLGLTRTKEAKQVAKICGVDKLIFKDYPDGQVNRYLSRLTTDLRVAIKSQNPDLVITYDQSGLYGHSDHIAASEVVTKLIKQHFPDTQLWYAALPAKQYSQITLPEHMAQDQSFKQVRQQPTLKVWIGISGIINKIRAIYTYQSQLSSLMDELPVKFIPLWVYLLLEPYEYFSET